jgi:hypothetical protein
MSVNQAFYLLSLLDTTVVVSTSRRSSIIQHPKGLRRQKSDVSEERRPAPGLPGCASQFQVSSAYVENFRV